MIPANILRGQIYFADLSEFSNREVGRNKPRPVLIIQNDIGNNRSTELIVAQITSAVYKTKYPTQMDITLELPSRICMEQICTIKKDKLLTYIGRLNTEELREADLRVAVSLQLITPRMIYQINVTKLLSQNNHENIFYRVNVELNNKQIIELDVSYNALITYFYNMDYTRRTDLDYITDLLNTLRGLKFLDKFIYNARYNTLSNGVGQLYT